MTISFEALTTQVEAGQALSAAEITGLAASPDILQLGMLADTVRRRARGTTVTYARVAACSFDASFAEAVLPAAREIRITGSPDTLDRAVAAVSTARAVAGARQVSGFSWIDFGRWGADTRDALGALRAAGLDALAELPLDRLEQPEEAIDLLTSTGFTQLRLTVAEAGGAERTALLLKAAALRKHSPAIHAINPLPMALNVRRPTTGYDDVKSVALARLAAPDVPVIQVDWSRYGPKLAQVALTFGADDLDAVSPSDESPDGRRRAPLEEVRRNIEAAGFQPVERDGRFEPIAG